MTAPQLVAALGRRAIADWIVIERASTRETSDVTRALERHEERRSITLVVHHDVAQGRGSARIELATEDATPAAAIDEAIAVATAAVGPAWKSVPQGAPAKVALVDPELGSPLAVTAPAGVSVQLVSDLLREQVAVYTRTGLAARWTAVGLRARALIATAARSLEVVVESRRHAEVMATLQTAFASAAVDLAALATAGRPVPGHASVILGPDALLHGHGAGVWAAFVTQADSVTERQGLTRYRPGTPVAAGADRASEPLAIDSDGALDFGWQSAPLGDDGGAVRRFSLVERGRAAGLALSSREAALRGAEPNGGVRNLVVARGSWDGMPPPGRTIEVRRLRNLAIDPYTGDASLDIEVGIDHDRGVATAFTGGTLQIDLIAALAHARRSHATVRRGAYIGPAAVWIDAAELLG